MSAGGDGMPAGVCADPFMAAFQAPDLMEKLASFKDTRQHLADPGFLATMKKLQALATDPALVGAGIMETSKVSQKIAQAGHYDPRVMQALMFLQGQGLVVDEKDLKKAEDVGDMKRREPVQLEQLQLVQDIQDADDAKAKGNAHFKSGDYAAALAHYEKGVELLRAREEVPAAAVATLLSNATMCLLKLKWPDRAKKQASMAIAVVRQAQDSTFDQSKLFYRRALACEQLRQLDVAVDDMARALQHAKKSDLALAEQHRLKGEVDRLKKLKASDDAHQQKMQEQKGNERTAEVQRMQGAALAPVAAKATSGAEATVSAASYLEERDYSHLALRRIQASLTEIRHKGDAGCLVEVTGLDEEKSKVEAAITTKRGVRALYYSMDLHLTWKGTAAPKLKPANGSSEMQGVFRLYNIAHDTNFQLGGDENTCYMYQMGWDHRLSGAWVEDLRTEAGELFDLVAARVDGVLDEFKKK